MSECPDWSAGISARDNQAFRKAIENAYQQATTDSAERVRARGANGDSWLGAPRAIIGLNQ